jgi:hypothetical protein
VQGLHQLDVVEFDPWGEIQGAVSANDIPDIPDDPFDNEAPQPPTNLQMTGVGSGCELTFKWEPSPWEDVQNYKMFRDGTFAGFAEGAS